MKKILQIYYTACSLLLTILYYILKILLCGKNSCEIFLSQNKNDYDGDDVMLRRKRKKRRKREGEIIINKEETFNNNNNE